MRIIPEMEKVIHFEGAIAKLLIANQNNPKTPLELLTEFDEIRKGFKPKQRYGNLPDVITFGEAIEFAKKGLAIARIGWNGKNMCIYLKKGNDSTSFVNKNGTVEYPSGIRGDLFEVGDTGTIRRLPCLCMKTADGSILEGWLASQSDILAEDWVTILPEIKE